MSLFLVNPFVFAAAGVAELIYVGGTTATSTTGDYSVSLTSLTGGVGTQPAAGDLVVLVTAIGVGTTNPSVSSSGWSLIYNEALADDTLDARGDVYFKMMGSTPDTSVSVVGQSAVGAATLVQVWRNADAASPVETLASASASNSCRFNSPSVNPFTAGSIVISAGFASVGTNSAYAVTTQPSGYSNTLLQYICGTSVGCTVGMASKSWSGSGAEDPAAWSGGTDAVGLGWWATSLVIRPKVTDASWSSVVLQLPFDAEDSSTNIVDVSNSAHVASISGFPNISITQRMLGTASLDVRNVSDDIVSFADHADWDVAGDYTVEFYVRFTNTYAGATSIMGTGTTSSSAGWYVGFNGSTPTLTVRINSTDYTGSGTFSTNTWYHIALVWYGTSFKVYVDGSELYSGTAATTTTSTALVIGKISTIVPNTGFIDGVRITKGVARYTSGFTRPTYPFASAAASEDTVVWNPSDKDSALTLSNGGLTVAKATVVWGSVRATYGKSSGKRYFEVYVDSENSTRNIMIGVAPFTAALGSTGFWATDQGGYGYYGNNGNKYEGAGTASNAAYGNTFTTGDVVGVAVDLDNGKIWWSKNGVWQASGDPAAGTGEAYSGLSGTFYPITGLYGTNTTTARFKSVDFDYTPPSGFSSWAAP